MKEINGTIIRHDPALSMATAPSRMVTKWDNTAMAGVIYITENFGEEE